MKVKKAVFPVGGLGTRFLPATKTLPKEMLPVANKPLIHHAFEEAVAAGIEEFIFITGRNKSAINDYFDCVYELEHVLDAKDKKEALALTRGWVPDAGKVAFIRQQQPMGLGHAVWCARHFVQGEPFAVLLADEMCINYNFKRDSQSLLSKMVQRYEQVPGNIIAVSEVDPVESHKYGIVKPKSDFVSNIAEIEDMVEKPRQGTAPSNFSMIGRYILDPEIFTFLDQTRRDRSGEIQLTDAMRSMMKAGAMTYGYKFEGHRFDCGNQLGFTKANIAFALQDESIKSEVASFIKEMCC